MQTGTLLIEFQYDEEEISLQRVEKFVRHAFDSSASLSTFVKVGHLEAADGDSQKAFGVVKP